MDRAGATRLSQASLASSSSRAREAAGRLVGVRSLTRAGDLRRLSSRAVQGLADDCSRSCRRAGFAGPDTNAPARGTIDREGLLHVPRAVK